MIDALAPLMSCIRTTGEMKWKTRFAGFKVAFPGKTSRPILCTEILFSL